jgi:Domain of unknown function (DUF4365)
MAKDASTSPVRKRLRVGHQSERGAINAVRTLLERHGMVVDEVDGRSDYGRDLNVDVTREGEVTGGIIGVQVKGGRSYCRSGRWMIPATPADWEYWRSSTVPIIGMVHDPDTDVIRWHNLTQTARSHVLIRDDSYQTEMQSDASTEVIVTDVLDDTSFDGFVRHVDTYLAATANASFLLLLDADDGTRRRGIFNCWTLGRRDPRPLVLVRRLLPTLSGRSLIDGIQVLAHATPHPDIFWNPRNWLSPPVEKDVQDSFRWSPDELVELVHRVETLDDSGAAWSRGNVGQSLWSIMVVDPDLRHTLPRAIRSAIETNRLQTAVRLLMCFQYVADDPVDDVSAVLSENPPLAQEEAAEWIMEELRQSGRFSPVY